MMKVRKGVTAVTHCSVSGIRRSGVKKEPKLTRRTKYRKIVIGAPFFTRTRDHNCLWERS